MAIGLSEMNPVDLRLAFYDLSVSRKDFVWVNQSKGLYYKCPLPTDCNNPNTFRVPKMMGGGFQNVFCDPYTVHDQQGRIVGSGYNWGILHCYVETLFENGWKIVET